MKKIFYLITLLTLAFAFDSNAASYKKAKVASPEKFTLDTFKDVYKEFNDKVEVIRKGSLETGAGFRDAFIVIDDVETRIICYGPGEYVNPHYHDEAEFFQVTKGGCRFHITLDGKTWTHSEVKAGDTIEVPANVIHCLVANDKEGLCMHVSRNDNTRSVVFVKDLKIPKWKIEKPQLERYYWKS